MKKSLLAMVALSAVAGVAQADVSLYGVLDMGIANLTSGANTNATMPAGVPTQIIPNNTAGKSVMTLAPNGMSQSVLGFKGSESIDGDLKAGFILEMGINPNTGTVSDGLNGLQHGTIYTSTGADSSRAGQLFQNRSTLNLTSKQYGSLSFGRQYSLTLDDIVNYDPLHGSYAFSVVGFFGGYGGSGWTEDARLDNSVKYNGKFGAVRVGAMYQYGGIAGNGNAGSAGQFGLGTDIGNLSLDAAVTFKKDGVGTLAAIPGVSTGMTALVSDNKAQSLFAKYVWNRATFSGGVQHIVFTNPTDQSNVSANIGAYGLGNYGNSYASVLSTLYGQERTLNLLFGGVTYAVTSAFDLTGAFYNVHQLDYSRTDNCATAAIGHCAGYLQTYSMVGDYHLSTRTDVYLGISMQSVNGGLSYVGADKYAATENVTTMVGFRTKF